jgi:hypothetical protein
MRGVTNSMTVVTCWLGYVTVVACWLSECILESLSWQ